MLRDGQEEQAETGGQKVPPENEEELFVEGG